MLVYKKFAVWQVGIILCDITSVVCDIRCTTEVVTVIEEGFLFCSVVWNITITSLWIIRVARVIP